MAGMFFLKPQTDTIHTSLLKGSMSAVWCSTSLEAQGSEWVRDQVLWMW